MTKKPVPKLVVNAKTLRDLSPEQLDSVKGAAKSKIGVSVSCNETDGMGAIIRL